MKHFLLYCCFSLLLYAYQVDLLGLVTFWVVFVLSDVLSHNKGLDKGVEIGKAALEAYAKDVADIIAKRGRKE